MIAPTESTELHGENAAWPLEAGMVMTALEAGSWNDERREHARAAFRGAREDMGEADSFAAAGR